MEEVSQWFRPAGGLIITGIKNEMIGRNKTQPQWRRWCNTSPRSLWTQDLWATMGRTLGARSRREKTEGVLIAEDFLIEGISQCWNQSKEGGTGEKTFCTLCQMPLQEFTSWWCHVHKQIMQTSYMLKKLVKACEFESSGQRSCTNNALTHFWGFGKWKPYRFVQMIKLNTICTIKPPHH